MQILHFIFIFHTISNFYSYFTGICKTCEGIDTIFGIWNFVHPARDCRDLQMSLESKRDIFHKELLHVKRLEKLEKIKQNQDDQKQQENKKKTGT